MQETNNSDPLRQSYSEARKNNKSLAGLMTNYNELVDQIFRFVYLKTNNKEIAEDLTSECFLSTVKYLKANEVRHIRAFLFKTARNKIIDYYRQKGRVIYSDEAVLANEEISGKDDLVNKQDARMIIGKLNLLGDDDREVLTMRYLEDLDIKEIAAAIGKNQMAVRVQIFRALRKLNKLVTGNKKNG